MAHDDERTTHGSADDEYGPTPADATYEHTDASVGMIVKFVIWLAVSAVVIHFGLGLVYALLVDRAMETGEPAYPLAVGQEQQLPPLPRLQQDPQAEFETFRAEEEALLENYGWMNREAGVVHIPIEEAMRLTVERGLPVRPSEAGGAAGETGQTPSDASGGQALERRR